jgi:hypothetical protein
MVSLYLPLKNRPFVVWGEMVRDFVLTIFTVRTRNCTCTCFRMTDGASRFSFFLHIQYWGRILGHDWEKVLRIFTLCYSQSALLTDFTPSPPTPLPPSPPSKSGLKLVKHCLQKPQVWELSRLCPETSIKLYVHEFGFWIDVGWSNTIHILGT